jgi:hypothetical protein
MTTIINNHGMEYMNADYEPPVLTEAEGKAIYRQRRGGHIQCKELMDEVLVCVRQLLENRKDKVSTYLHAHGVFSVYDIKEFMAQINQWRKQGCKLLKCNIKEEQCGKYGKATFFTIQPPNMGDDTPWSPVSMAFGTMVSGFTYFTIDPAVAEIVWKALGSHE